MKIFAAILLPFKILFFVLVVCPFLLFVFYPFLRWYEYTSESPFPRRWWVYIWEVVIVHVMLPPEILMRFFIYQIPCEPLSDFFGDIWYWIFGLLDIWDRSE
ncbi:hypothetical protein LCGC14_0326440 [marine sediment metagenome]|uniref:Uncharacterized protein n=1 Tax=marine sediment metagenome TaxID=412755 RepID=A0A0F9U0N0_9ZZZZ